MAGGDLPDCRHPEIYSAGLMKTPPRGRAERLQCGLPAYVNCKLDGLDDPTPREIPQALMKWGW